MTEGFDFGNARVRARRSELLDAERLRRLAAFDIDRLVAALSDTPYRPDLEAAIPRFEGRRLVAEALRTNLARVLREVVRWYEGAAAADVALVVDRWDLRNLRAVLRGQFARGDPDEIRAALVPAGRVGDEELAALVAQPGLRAAVEMMMVWRVPTPAVAAAALGGLAGLEATGDFQAFERAVEAAAAKERKRSVAAADRDVARVLRAEIDQINLLTALRLVRAQPGPGEWDVVDPGERFLEGGAVATGVLRAVARADDAAAAVELLDGAVLPAPWRPPLARWAEDDDLLRLNGAIDEAMTRWVAAGFSTADPLGPGVPVAYVWAKENEVKNLRTIAAGTSSGLTTDEIEEQLVIL
jgi:V/A-type H+-transporting ATPase subunit C